LPGNFAELSNAHLARRIHEGNPTFVRAIATAVEGDHELPPDGRPTTAAPDASIGWLQDAIANGDLDRLPDDDPIRAGLVARYLQLVQVGEDFEGAGSCSPLDEPVTLDLDRGDRVDFSVFQVEADITSDTLGDFERTFNANYGNALVATTPIHVVFTNALEAKTGELCH